MIEAEAAVEAAVEAAADATDTAAVDEFRVFQKEAPPNQPH